jgi:hypothetical protein
VRFFLLYRLLRCKPAKKSAIFHLLKFKYHAKKRRKLRFDLLRWWLLRWRNYWHGLLLNIEKIHEFSLHNHLFTFKQSFFMKKMLFIGLLITGAAATSFAAYQFAGYGGCCAETNACSVENDGTCCGLPMSTDCCKAK